MNYSNRIENVKRELQSLSIGHVKMIEWEPVVRWSEDSFEIGTYNKKRSTLEETVESLTKRLVQYK